MANGTGWQEEYLDERGRRGHGSKDQEERFFDAIAQEMRQVVRHFEKANGRPMRGNHAKMLAGVAGAEFRVSSQIPPDLAVGFLREPGQVYPAHVRFSNAGSAYRADDSRPDLRGVAVRILTGQGDHDFLMTNAEPHHARDAREAMIAIVAGVKKDSVEGRLPGGGLIKAEARDRIAALIGAFGYLLIRLGPGTARRIAGALSRQMAREVHSLATETYWSRAPIAIGGVPDPERSVAVKYRLAPDGEQPARPGNRQDLGRELKDRLGQGQVKFLFQVQRYIDPATTPIEDATVAWPSPFETIAELTIPQNAGLDDDFVDGLTFSPWNVDLTSFQPLGSMNRARRKVYQASAGER